MELLLFALGMMFSVSLVVLRLALVEIIKIKSTQGLFIAPEKGFCAGFAFMAAENLSA